MPNNRQLATVVWLVAALAFALSRRDLRASFGGVARAAASPKLLAPVTLFIAWVAGLVFVAARLGLWDPARATDTAFWLVTVGVVLFGNFDRVSKEKSFFREKAAAAVRVSVFIEVFSEVFVLGLVAEFLLQPAFVVLGSMSVVAGQNPENKPVKRLADGLLLIATASLLLYGATSLVHNWSSLDKGDLLRQFALPVWLAVGVLPCVYLVGLVSAYELAFMRIGWKSQGKWWPSTRAKLVLLTSFRFRAAGVGAFAGPWQFKLAQSTSFADGRRVIREFRQAVKEEAEQAVADEERLVRYAGVDGVDVDGRRLDRREFEATARALRWVGTCQMGRHRREDWGRYRADLLDFALDGYAGRDLPKPHGVEMRVSDDGQKWYAWRRTISGWVFAIGAAGAPPDQWEYDGPEPPSGFPGDSHEWGEEPFTMGANVNWC